jgi:signal transduction histidine kinase
MESIPKDLPNEDRTADRPGDLDSLCNLASGIAHELRNPLNTISLAFQLLRTLLEQRGADLGIDLEDHFCKIHFELGKMRKILDNFTRFRAPGDLAARGLDLRAVVEAALSETEGDCVRGGIDVQDRFPRGLEVNADPSMLTEALVHLINNAIDAMPDGGRLTIQGGCDGSTHRIVVEDTGEGIPEAERARVFEPYFTTRPERLGIGLTMAAGIVRAHRGRVLIRGGAPGGTVVVIEIPRDGSSGNDAGPRSRRTIADEKGD